MRPPILLALSLALIAIGASACGEEERASTEDAATEDAAPAAGESAVEIVDFKFSPATIEVEAGTEISWHNADDAAHTASAEDGSFDTGTLAAGDSGSATVEKAGTYAYICEFHPFMKGTIEVQ